jgi:hypothetical protein
MEELWNAKQILCQYRIFYISNEIRTKHFLNTSQATPHQITLYSSIII